MFVGTVRWAMKTATKTGQKLRDRMWYKGNTAHWNVVESYNRGINGSTTYFG